MKNVISQATQLRERSDARALLVLSAVASVVFLGDALFWRAEPGVSVGVFALILGGLCLALQPASVSWRTGGLGAMLLVSCAQTAVEISLSNVIAIVVLLIAIVGETYFRPLPTGIVRTVEAAISLVRAPVRWASLGKAILESPVAISSSTVVAGDNVARGLRVMVPGLALCGLFAVILSSGNALLERFFRNFASRLTESLLDFDFSPWRCALWVSYATLVVGLVWHDTSPTVVRGWTQTWPRWRRAHRREALWQSIFALLMLNALFFVANTIDAIYLWRNRALPADVNPSDYLHEGVWSLILAVVLSAGLLAAMFQQQEDISSSRLFKALGLVWVAQNLVLIASVFLRLKLYVDVWQLTEKRVYVGCFLVLVITGFSLLAWSIMHSRGLHWLIVRNLVATFVLFFALQFPNVAGLVAHYNVARWQRDPNRSLDLDYLVMLGPGAWPALVELAGDQRDPSIGARAAIRVSSIAARESVLRKKRDWRSWQIRRDAGVKSVLAPAQ